MARKNQTTRAVATGASYINVDLEVRSRANLAPLVAVLEGPLDSLYAGRLPGGHLATFETAGVQIPPDRAIRRMVDAISALRGPARALWDGARDRVFDVGLERDQGRGIVAFGLKRETIELAAKVGARIAFTVYEPERRPRVRKPRVPPRKPG
jgi:hypothetical protein